MSVRKNEKFWEGTGFVDWELSIFLKGLFKFTKPCEMTNVAYTLAQNRTRYLSNTSTKRCSLNQLSPCNYNYCNELKILMMHK